MDNVKISPHGDVVLMDGFVILWLIIPWALFRQHGCYGFLRKKLCPAGKAAAKRKFKVYPSAYANGWAVQYCKGKFRGKKGKKK